MSRIGILGGSFNPPHKAHREIARQAREQFTLDTVFWMPTARPPHKSEQEFVSDEHRGRMVKLMVESMEDSAFRFSDFELKKGGVSYTHETLEAWKNEHPEDDIFFILGGDSLKLFDSWRLSEKISQLATILAAPREGMTQKELKALCKQRSKEFPGEFFPIKMKKTYADYSSTMIRRGYARKAGRDHGKGVAVYPAARIVRCGAAVLFIGSCEEGAYEMPESDASSEEVPSYTRCGGDCEKAGKAVFRRKGCDGEACRARRTFA